MARNRRAGEPLRALRPMPHRGRSLPPPSAWRLAARGRARRQALAGGPMPTSRLGPMSCWRPFADCLALVERLGSAVGCSSCDSSERQLAILFDFGVVFVCALALRLRVLSIVSRFPASALSRSAPSRWSQLWVACTSRAWPLARTSQAPHSTRPLLQWPQRARHKAQRHASAACVAPGPCYITTAWRPDAISKRGSIGGSALKCHWVAAHPACAWAWGLRRRGKTEGSETLDNAGTRSQL